MMKEGYTIKDQTKAHFITATVVGWIDIFSRQIYRDCVIESLSYCIKKKGMIVYGYVIMTNHIHLITESRREWMLERFYKATLSHSRNKNYQVWRYWNHAEEIFTEKFLWSKLNYIHLNPVRAGIVSRASDYVYSSASNYVFGKGILKEVHLADNSVQDVLKSWEIMKYNNY